MLAIQKLVRNGSATQVTIPAEFLRWLEWRCGDVVDVQVLEDGALLVRRSKEYNVSIRRPRIVDHDVPATVKP